ncbi:5-(carboxyamino)imidazole ribonucleotide synthase [Frigoribacterium sp. CFBP 8754]|uniref:5-(carboxyamino)imidazole ribonucleotide synthase n=1 Tax=unclassified Frigoribacterium TaxID=2627005 RepID=UPI00177DBBD1|nr:MULTISPECIES: 5-(carboxyamino)imidazole ribonucleotide synthase [unclassified Frigoribacterium]MBD8658983.1 5-(carboxyamino)imidazole ribonucleotide synthase [Frigoribacterium sp. CFBP 8754]MBD8727278.1 5-(carboxyamino)imidazole ribonucleotide synthase [Frigoribacterium sp. CFBP 13707]
MAYRIGVIGGGQLARMMVPPAVHLGVEITVLAEAVGSSARLAASEVGDYHDAETVLAFARDVDVVTFDHEHVPQDVLTALVEAGVAVHPAPAALAVAQDKIVMRRRLTELGLPVPEWAEVRDAADLAGFLAEHGGRAVVKTPRGGYDGKGVRVVDDPAGADDWFAVLAEQGEDAVLLVEELVPFERELAQLVARRPSGEIAVWPLVETVQRDGVCAEVTAPAPRSEPELQQAAEQIARRVADELGVTGVLAVELFETADGRLLVNELAMRPHNTGHWSIDGAATSQFEQHLRAVLDLPLGDTGAHHPWSVMVNVLGGPATGTMADRLPALMAAEPGAKVHDYGKDPRPGRKVGHVTTTGAELADVLARARAAVRFFED